MTLKKPRLSLIGSNESDEEQDDSPVDGQPGLTINVNALAADEMGSSPLFSPPAQEVEKPRNPLAELLKKL